MLMSYKNKIMRPAPEPACQQHNMVYHMTAGQCTLYIWRQCRNFLILQGGPKIGTISCTP